MPECCWSWLFRNAKVWHWFYRLRWGCRSHAPLFSSQTCLSCFCWSLCFFLLCFITITPTSGCISSSECSGVAPVLSIQMSFCFYEINRQGPWRSIRCIQNFLWFITPCCAAAHFFFFFRLILFSQNCAVFECYVYSFLMLFSHVCNTPCSLPKVGFVLPTVRFSSYNHLFVFSFVYHYWQRWVIFCVASNCSPE